MSASIHTPVLLQQVIEYLHPQAGQTIFDGTLGGGGYTVAISKLVGTQGRVIAVDQDIAAIRRFDTAAHPNVELHHANFAQVATITGENSLDGAVLDLGISSDQLGDEQRGISFQNPQAALDMRMNASEGNKLTAWGILNTWSEEELADAIYQYGDERKSRQIAREIVLRRNNGEMETVEDLLEAVYAVKPRRGRINPATQTFQALRIVVNDELGSLKRFLQNLPQVCRPQSRVVIVSFHSKEDRIVKQQCKQWEQDGIAHILTPKPITPTDQEVQENPRARSSKLRAVQFNT